MKTKTSVFETVSECSYSGSYGNTANDKVVKNTRTGKHYAVIDHWCGGDIEGTCYRPHVYELPESLVAEAVRAISPEGAKNETGDEYGCLLTNFLQFELNDCECLGRQSSLPWAKNM